MNLIIERDGQQYKVKVDIPENTTQDDMASYCFALMQYSMAKIIELRALAAMDRNPGVEFTDEMVDKEVLQPTEMIVKKALEMAITDIMSDNGECCSGGSCDNSCQCG